MTTTRRAATAPSGRRPDTAPRPRGHRTLVLLESATGVAALVGGTLLIVRPDGSLLGLGLALLQDSPFADWRVPGVLLATSVGVGFLLVATWQAFDLPHARAFAVLAGTGLVVFELSEFAWLGAHPLQVVFSLVGAAIVALAVRKRVLAPAVPLPLGEWGEDA